MRTSLFIFFMVIFIGCSENDIIDEGEKPEDPQAEIEVYYDQESTSSRKPDAGAKVYLYYDINITTEFGGLASYEGNGILKYKRYNTVIKPDSVLYTDYLGKTVFDLKPMDEMSIVAESSYFPNMITYTVCFHLDESMKITVTPLGDIKWELSFSRKRTPGKYRTNRQLNPKTTEERLSSY